MSSSATRPGTGPAAGFPESVSRFDFGVLAGLPNARAWQAKERH